MPVFDPFEPERARSGESVARRARDAPPQRGRTDHLTSRRWFCRSCGKEAQGSQVPEGWYSLGRHVTSGGDFGRGIIRLGLFCSVTCLYNGYERVRCIDEDLKRNGVPLGTRQATMRGH